MTVRSWLASFLAALSFSLMASAVYLFNDWRDCESDAQHPVETHRPLAAGLVSPTSALAVMSGLALASALCGPGSATFQSLLIFTMGLSPSHIPCGSNGSCWRMRLSWQVSTLPGSTLEAWPRALRCCAMAAPALLVHLSGPGFQKRYAELAATPETGKPLAGRGYHLSDIDHMRGMGHAAGFMTVLVFALYTHSPGVTDHYSNPTVLWWICPLILFWLCRLWLLTGRGQVSEDAILFALKDRTSFCLGVCAVVIAHLAGPI